MRPFKEYSTNFLNLYNEFVLIVTFLCIAVINIFNTNENSSNYIGWMVIALLLLSLGITWILLIPSVVKGVYQQIKDCSQSGSTTQVKNLNATDSKYKDKNEKNEAVIKLGIEDNRRKTI